MYCGQFYNGPGGNELVRIIPDPVTSPTCSVVLMTHAETDVLGLDPITPSHFVEIAGQSAGLLLLAFLVAYFVGVMVKTVR